MRGWIEKRTTPRGEGRFIARWRDAAALKHARTFTHRRDALAHLEAVLPGATAGTTVTGRVWLAAYLADLQHRHRLGAVSPSTYAAYTSILRCHLAPWLTDLRLARLTPQDVATWTAHLSEDVADGTLAPKTYNNVLGVWSALVTFGAARGLVPATLADGLHRARVLRREVAVLDATARAALLAAAPTPRLRLALTVALYGGLRRGELCGLQWGDLTPGEVARVRVSRAVVGTVVRPPKTAGSRRVVDVPGFLVTRWAEVRGDDAPARWVLPARTNRQTPMHPDVFQQAVAPAFHAVGRSCSLHLCRHTYASLLIAQGESLKYVSAQLGHASIQITQDLYGHLFHDSRRAAMDRLAQWAGSGQESPTPGRDRDDPG
jgi:integrase